MVTTEDRKEALIECLREEKQESINPNEIEQSSYSDDRIFDTPYGEYWVLTDDEADEEFEEAIKDLIDEIGVESIQNIEWYIDEDKLERELRGDITNWIADEPEIYVDFFPIDKMKEDIIDELISGDVDNFLINKMGYSEETLELMSPNDRKNDIKEFIDEMDDEEVIEWIEDDSNLDIYDYVEEAVDNYFDEFDDSSVEILKDIYGDGKELSEILEPYFNIDEFIETVKINDGRGSMLASYDGMECEIQSNGIWFYIYRLN